MIEELKRVLEKCGVEYAEIRVEEREGTAIYYSGKELEIAERKRSFGGCIRTFHKGGWGFVTFNKLKDLEDWLHRSERQAKTMKRESGLAPVKPVRDKVRLSLPDDPRKVPLEEKHELVRKYNQIVMGHEKIQTTRVGYEDTFIRKYYVNTEGTEIVEERVYSGVRMVATAVDGTNVQISFDSVGGTQGWNSVLGLEDVAERVCKEAVEMLKAEPVEAGVYTVVVDPQLAGVFAHEAFGHLSEADHIYENERIREIMKLGTRFGVDELSIVDDGTIKGERGYYPYDDEGVPSQRTYLIKNGILVGRLHSRETAYKMGEEPTGNARAINFAYPPIVRMSCTFIEPGDKTFEELTDIERGIYAIGAYGGQTELEMFTFSARRGYLIEKGKITKLLKNVVLTGNVFETLRNIDAIGNDLKLYGGLGGCGKGGQFPLPVSDGAPHIRIRNVVIGGK
ncbi:hypothetical protein DRQ18_08020 [bacterium]|nr:MAG: hypothetical protein DRQ18_08020 [bacterium]